MLRSLNHHGIETPCLQRAARDDRHVEAAAVPGDDRRALRVEPVREVGEHLPLGPVLADDAEALGDVVLEQHAAQRHDLVVRRRRDALALVEPRQLGIRNRLDVEDEVRGAQNLALLGMILYRGRRRRKKMNTEDRRAPGRRGCRSTDLVEVGGALGPSFEAQAVNVSEDGMHLRTAYLPEQGSR